MDSFLVTLPYAVLSKEAKYWLIFNEPSEDLQLILAQDSDYEIRRRLAGVTTNTKIMWKLAHDEHTGVLISLAKNKEATTSILEQLIEKKSLDIKAAVLYNKRTPRKILNEHAVMPNNILSSYAIITLNKLQKESIDVWI